MSVQQFWNLSQLLGVFTCRKLPNLCQNFITENVQTTFRNYQARLCCEKLGTSHFWSVLLLKEQMMTSVRKTLKTLVWSTQNRSISSDVFPENNHKIRRFFTDCFPTKFVLKIPAKFREIGRFSAILSLKIPRNLTFFPRNLSEALSLVDSVDRSILLAARSIWTDLDTLVQILPLSRFSTHFNSAAPPHLNNCSAGPELMVQIGQCCNEPESCSDAKNWQST